jgi:nucleotide-binding universal stress UspA family protein
MFPRIRRILVPLDFSPSADQALSYARAFAIDFGASLHLVHVVEDRLLSSPWPNEVYQGSLYGLRERLIKEAEKRLSDCASSVRTNGLRVTLDVLIGAPSHTIVDTANDLDADLIVMGTHGRTGISHLFIGSVAERVVRHAACPVLVVGSRKAADRAEETVPERERVGEVEDSRSTVPTV